MKINSISASHSEYPDSLTELFKKPNPLYVIGSLPTDRKMVAIVGTRKPTQYGKTVTHDIASKLAERGVVIVSGLAHGIDSIAHEAALSVGGLTVAVLPGGLDAIYPASHHGLAERIIKSGGTLVSEYPAGTPPLQHRFLERNRIVTGLSQAVIVTEAGAKSGTMNTTAHALEQGRDVYAVPGPITSAMSLGSNALIAQGAAPIVSIDTFIKELLGDDSGSQSSLLAQTEPERLVLELIGDGISDGDEIAHKAKLSTNEYHQIMTMLEIRGVVRSLGGNKWSL